MVSEASGPLVVYLLQLYRVILSLLLVHLQHTANSPIYDYFHKIQRFHVMRCVHASLRPFYTERQWHVCDAISNKTQINCL